MQKRFDTALQRILGESNPKLLLAVSGGVDSMCLAELARRSRLRLNFSLAHANFSLRQDESDGDEEFVHNWAESNGIELFTARFDTRAHAAARGISIEMAARDLRYAWFGDLMQEHGFAYIVTAHNRNDNVETFFLNLLRGCGLGGVCGMKEKSGTILHPMLEFTRAEIEQFALADDIQWRNDSSNGDVHFQRNRIRNAVFPQFEQINPSFLETICIEMERFSDARAIVEDAFEDSAIRTFGDNGRLLCQLDIEALKKDPHRRQWLFLSLSPYGFNDSQLKQIEESLYSQSGKRFYSKGYMAVRDREYIKVYYNDAVTEPDEGLEYRIYGRSAEFDPHNAPEGTLYLDADKVELPLRARIWQKADRFHPLGFRGGASKKVSDYLTNIKLDMAQKSTQRVIVFTDGEGREQIAAVEGHRIDNRYKITDATVRILEIAPLG